MRYSVWIANLLMAVSLPACGSGTILPPPPTPIPAISNLAATFATGPCIRAADGLTGRALVVAFDYSDVDSDVSGGRVQLNRVYNTGRSEGPHFFAVPSQVTLTGTSTSGQIRIDNACPLYKDATSSTETISLIDAGGQVSNSLSTTVNRPAGAP